MSHHYLRDHYGDHCFYADNSWKRYQRYHSGDTYIFNFGNNCCGGGYGGWYGGCCGGGGTFWDGLCTSLTMGFSGLMSGFMNMPFMGMFGGGFGMPFGGNMWSNCLWGIMPWGNIGGGVVPPGRETLPVKTPNNQNVEEPEPTPKHTEQPKSKQQTPGQHTEKKTAEELRVKITELQQPNATINQETLQPLYDYALKLDNGAEKNNILAELEAIAADKKIPLTGADGNAIDGTPNLGSLLSDDDWNKITSTDDDIKISNHDKFLLQSYGIKPIKIGKAQNQCWCVTLPDDLHNITGDGKGIKALELLEKLQINVAVANNTGIDSDKWIAGQISNVNLANNGYISYEINCSTVNESCRMCGYKFTVTEVDSSTTESEFEWLIKYKEGWQEDDPEYYYPVDGIMYQDGSNCLTRNSGIPHISNSPQKGYTQFGQ